MKNGNRTWFTLATFQRGAKGPRACFSKVPKTFRARKAICKTPTRFFCKAGLFSVVKRTKLKINAKFCASRRLRYEDTKRIMSPETRPRSFGTFEKRAPEHTECEYVGAAVHF